MKWDIYAQQPGHESADIFTLLGTYEADTIEGAIDMGRFLLLGFAGPVSLVVQPHASKPPKAGWRGSDGNVQTPFYIRSRNRGVEAQMRNRAGRPKKEVE